MAELVEGIWKCKVLGGEANADDKDIITVRISVEILDGPDKGRRATYEDRVNNKSAKYIALSARAVGWRARGKVEETFRTDVDEWIARTGGESTVEIEHILRKTGAKAGTYWGKPRSIGRKPKALVRPSREASDDANDAMIRAVAELNESNNSGGGGGYDDVPPPSDDNIPFISDSPAHDRVTAKVPRW